MRTRLIAAYLFIVLVVSASSAQPLGTAFTYQGRLENAGGPVNGVHDLQFVLYGVPTGGARVAGPILAENVNVTDGLFTVPLDFGAAFDGNERWVEIGVRADSTAGNCDTGEYTPLTPRQAVTAAPYASFASNADQLDGLDSTAFLQSIPNPLTLAGTNATHIIRGENSSTTNGAAGVFGETTADIGITYGGRFESASNLGRGVYGRATRSQGTNFGVYGESDSNSGRGVYGVANGTEGSTYGGQFVSVSTGGRGVSGRALAATGPNYGVRGESVSANGYGVYSLGDMGASGVKPFRIDHPDDPANKYLLHYAAESPEVINFYSGNVTLDVAGEAMVELPHYFAKINRDPRYTLTAIGAAMPMLHVAAKISEADLSAGARAEPNEAAPMCSFRIAGGAPGGEVSWRVEALRNDRWVQKRGAPVEVEKQDLERGTYQHPELYGQPPEKGMNYETNSERQSEKQPPFATTDALQR